MAWIDRIGPRSSLFALCYVLMSPFFPPLFKRPLPFGDGLDFLLLLRTYCISLLVTLPLDRHPAVWLLSWLPS